MNNVNFLIVLIQENKKRLYLNRDEQFQSDLEKAFIYDNIDWAVRTLIRISKYYDSDHITIQINEG